MNETPATGCDVVIIGQGLAGTTLAWHLHWRGVKVSIIDREPDVTSSRIAAGLVTPITGKRLAKLPDLDITFPIAVDFYRRVERELGVEFFRLRNTVRLFISEEERAVYAAKANTEFVGWVTSDPPELDANIYDAPLGAFEMNMSAQLQTRTYLDHSRERFRAGDQYRRADVDLVHDLQFQEQYISLPKLNMTARWCVIAEGFPDRGASEWFPEVRFEAAKGEILTLRIPGLHENRIINRGGTWLAPHDNDLYRTGSTYDRDHLDEWPTAAGREEMLRKLAAFLKLPVEVVDHQAGVRPITSERAPVIHFHKQHPNLAYFNGLHSKGSLLAPRSSAELAERILNERK